MRISQSPDLHDRPDARSAHETPADFFLPNDIKDVTRQASELARHRAEYPMQRLRYDGSDILIAS
jgi:hypothetical protein